MTKFQKQVVNILRKENRRMTTEEITNKLGRAEKSVKKALVYLRGAEIVRDHQKAPPREVPASDEQIEKWKKRVKEWKKSDNPERDDRWELIPEDEREKTLEEE